MGWNPGTTIDHFPQERAGEKRYVGCVPARHSHRVLVAWLLSRSESRKRPSDRREQTANPGTSPARTGPGLRMLARRLTCAFPPMPLRPTMHTSHPHEQQVASTQTVPLLL